MKRALEQMSKRNRFDEFEVSAVVEPQLALNECMALTESCSCETLTYTRHLVGEKQIGFPFINYQHIGGDCGAKTVHW
jgi:hypothetical protein